MFLSVAKVPKGRNGEKLRSLFFCSLSETRKSGGVYFGFYYLFKEKKTAQVGVSFIQVGVVCLKQGKLQIFHETVEIFLVGPILVPLPKGPSLPWVSQILLLLTPQDTNMVNVASVFSKMVCVNGRSNDFDNSTIS